MTQRRVRDIQQLLDEERRQVQEQDAEINELRHQVAVEMSSSIDLQDDFNRRWRDQMEIEAIENQKMRQLEAELTDALHAVEEAKALLDRSLREALHHNIDCPFSDDVFVTFSGRAWHSDPHCRFLAEARSVQTRTACRGCACETQTPDVLNAMTGTSLQEDILNFFAANRPRCSYEDFYLQ